MGAGNTLKQPALAHMCSAEVIINTVSSVTDYGPQMALLRANGALCIVSADCKEHHLNSSTYILLDHGETMIRQSLLIEGMLKCITPCTSVARPLFSDHYKLS